MTIDKALEELRLLHSSPLLYETENYRDAVRLGIEALKHYQQETKSLGATKTMWLLGETEI